MFFPEGARSRFCLAPVTGAGDWFIPPPARLMHFPLIGKRKSGTRFERFNLVLAILLAGWVPSTLTLVVSYTILRNTLESKILRDRQTFVQLIGHMVGDDLSRTGGIIEYYQTLPDTAKLLTTPNI